MGSLRILKTTFLYTVMVFAALGCGAVRPRDRPNLITLRSFKKTDGSRMDIIRHIATEYQHFGTLLLNDEDGSIIDTIVETRQKNPVDITNDIFRRWINGEGVAPHTWATLVSYLREVGRNIVADSIEEAYTMETEVDTSSTSSGKENEAQSPSDDEDEVSTTTIEDLADITESDGLHHVRSLVELLKATSEIGDWEGLCTNLRVVTGVMSALIYSPEQVSTKRRRCLESYFNSGEAYWKNVVVAIAGAPIYNTRVAMKIAKKFGIDFNDVRDEL